ncbi:AGAP009060-PA-like protein [Anopheles sinensis]|uniref:DNA 3'-5' helicase n=1 Tax=Anopheles sinensis TaxID=74873 RepID=A0A084WQK9_ANOSI|nr:AGAP009060-PA-like protein [Anopheles sinensis]
MAQLTLPQTPFPLVPQNVLSAENRPFTINDLPPAVRVAFPGLKAFNKLQVTVAGAVLQSEDSLVVNAPTGSGKTVILELAIVKLSVECAGVKPFRVVYLAPTRSLCAEKYHEWRARFAALGVSCIQYDGDNAVEDIGKLGQHQLILSTPEKWEVFTRHWGDQTVANVLQPVRLFLIDEIQVMDDGVRGANLELVVSRMKFIDSRLHRGEQRGDCGQPESIRFIAVSACIPNVDDIARWLKNERNVLPFSFTETYRTTRIGRHVFGYPCTSNPYKFEMDLNYKLPAIIDEYSRQKPTLVFCSSRKSAETTASFLARSNIRRSLPAGAILAQISSQIVSKPLRDCVEKGVAFHHAGLLLSDRTCIETHFRSGHLAALCCTSTLCMGVNLPAYLVIIKSTFSFGGKNYSDNYILQMIGRAGRAQYNEDGVAVILTAEENAEHYRKLVAGTAPIESQLHHRLAELLNSEIAHGIIYDQPAVMEWIRSTFFYVRARTNPAHYRLSGARDIEDEIEQMCRDTIDSLEESGLILKRRPNALFSTVCGKLMTRNHLSFKTMRVLQSDMKGTESLQEMLQLVARADEFSEYKCRTSEKRILNSLNVPPTKDVPGGHPEEFTAEEPPTGVRFRWPGRISTTEAKVYCLVQAVFGNLTINDHGLHQEAAKIVTLGARIGRCVVGLLNANGDQLPAGCFQAMLNVSRLIQCFQAKLWYDSPFITKQLDQIGPKLARHLADRGKVTFQAVRESDPREIEWILKKQPPVGNDIISFVDSLPQFSIEITKTTDAEKDEAPEPIFSCTVSQKNMQYEPRNVPISYSVLVGDSSNRLLLHRTIENMTHADVEEGNNGFTWPIYPSNISSLRSLSAYLVCSDWVGLDCEYTLDLVDPPAITKHKQTTITHFFPNQTITTNNTTMLPVDQVPISCAQEESKAKKVSTLNDSYGISAFLNSLRGANISAGNMSFASRMSVPAQEKTIANRSSIEVPAAFKSVNTVTNTSLNLSTLSMNNTSLATNSLMKLLRNPTEGSLSLSALANRKLPGEATSHAIAPASIKERLEMAVALKSKKAITTSSEAGNVSNSVLARPPRNAPTKPLRSILKRPAPTIGESFKNLPPAEPSEVRVRRRLRPYFSSEEFRHMFRERKYTQCFILCSPSEDIIDCFKRYNLFLTVGDIRRRWCLFPEQRNGTPFYTERRVTHEREECSAVEAIPPVVRKKKNFNLGRAEDVICMDE